jgi:hypothetical protein
MRVRCRKEVECLKSVLYEKIDSGLGRRGCETMYEVWRSLKLLPLLGANRGSCDSSFEISGFEIGLPGLTGPITCQDPARHESARLVQGPGMREREHGERI